MKQNIAVKVTQNKNLKNLLGNFYSNVILK